MLNHCDLGQASNIEVKQQQLDLKQIMFILSQSYLDSTNAISFKVMVFQVKPEESAFKWKYHCEINDAEVNIDEFAYEQGGLKVSVCKWSYERENLHLDRYLR